MGIRYFLKLEKWSRGIRKRDKYICYLCERSLRHKLMEAHHIYPKSLHKDKTFSRVNGITLCRRCHRDIVHVTKNSWQKFCQMFSLYTNSFNKSKKRRQKDKIKQ